MQRKLTADEVGEIRARLGLTRVQLAETIGVSESAIRHWESGERETCDGPAALLLLLLDRYPTVLESLDRPAHALPRAGAIPRSDEWLRLQRLIGVTELRRTLGGGGDSQWWSEVYATEGLTRRWVEEMEREGLLRRTVDHGEEAFVPTEIAKRKLALGEWRSWYEHNVDQHRAEDLGDFCVPDLPKIPLMPLDRLPPSLP
jgi:transcriptional regulator with XRE-family HTH domain